MNFFNRAMKNVTRRISKSVLLAITFFLIGNLVIIGLGINSAAENAKILTRQKMRAVVSYETDYEAFWEYTDNLSEEEQQQAYENYPYVRTEDVVSLLQDERVKAVNMISTNIMYAGNFETVPLNNQAEQNSGNNIITYDDGTTDVYVEPNVRLQTNHFPNMIELEDGTYEVTQGRFYTQQEVDEGTPVCLITEDLASLNNLRVGDVIELNLMNPSEIARYYPDSGVTEEDIRMSLEIIGIFRNNEQLDENSDQFQWMSRYESPKNVILAPTMTYANAYYDFSVKQFNYYAQQYPDAYQDTDTPKIEDFLTTNQAVFLLNDPLEVDQFVEDHQDSLKEFMIMDANNETFKQLARPLDTLSLFSNIIVWIVAVNAVVIITLVTALTLKTREYEIGVLLSIGVTKMKIVAQFFTELIVVALIGFTLSIASGSLIAGRVGEAMLNYQVDTENEYTTLDEDDSTVYFGDNNYFTEVTQEDLLSEYEVRISPMIIAEIYVLGIGVVFVSIVIPSLMIMRFNPKKILMNQN